VFNVVGVTIMLFLIDPIAQLSTTISPSAEGLEGQARLAQEAPRQIANAYTIAKTGMLVLFLPFTRRLAALVERLVPLRPSEIGVEPQYLDIGVLETPSIALDLARKEIARMGKRVQDQVDRAVPTVLTGTSAELTALAEGDDEIDALNDAILAYLRQISDDRLTEAEAHELQALMEATSYLELVGDIVESELVRLGLRRIEEAVPVSEETLEVVTDFHAKMSEMLRTAVEAFATEDPKTARTVLEAKPDVNQLLASAAAHHATRITAEAPARVAAYARGTETIESLRRIYTFAKRIARTVPGVDG